MTGNSCRKRTDIFKRKPNEQRKMPYTDQRALLSKLQILTDRIENATVKISGEAVHQKSQKSSTELRSVVARLEAVVAKLEGGSAGNSESGK